MIVVSLFMDYPSLITKYDFPPISYLFCQIQGSVISFCEISLALAGCLTFCAILATPLGGGNVCNHLTEMRIDIASPKSLPLDEWLSEMRRTNFCNRWIPCYKKVALKHKVADDLAIHNPKKLRTFSHPDPTGKVT